MAGTANLYTRDVLALATSLSDWPLTSGLSVRGTARSATCGSRLAIGLDLDDSGGIAAIGLQAQACAIGQAAAAIFAAHASGCGKDEVIRTLDELADWLAGTGALPAWPGLEAIAAARDYPARHGAILLPWQAAREALSYLPKPS